MQLKDIQENVDRYGMIVFFLIATNETFDLTNKDQITVHHKSCLYKYC